MLLLVVLYLSQRFDNGKLIMKDTVTNCCQGVTLRDCENAFEQLLGDNKNENRQAVYVRTVSVTKTMSRDMEIRTLGVSQNNSVSFSCFACGTGILDQGGMRTKFRTAI